jgi:predicted RNA-binding protein with PIN domain
LVRLIQLKKLAGSSRNRVVIVFDGYPDASSGDQAAGSVEVVFSCSESADERIKYLVDHAASPKELIVVSDDRDVQFYARSAGAVPMAVEDFIGRADEKKRSSARRERGDASDPKLNYSQMERINKELRDRWLKGSG